jgi:hypothetical protein
MNLVLKVGLAAGCVGLLTFACSSTPAPEQAVVASNVQPNPASQAGCISPEKFIYLPESADIPGPDTNVPDTDTPNPKDMLVPTGTGDVVVQCSVVPSGSAYNVQLQAQITGGTAPGTLTVSGTFTPRQRDANGNPTSDSTTIPNIVVDMLDATKHLHEADCIAQYVEVDNGTPGTTSLPNNADTYADDHGGRIWASVFCAKPMHTDEGTKPGNAGCEMSATFRFENCTSKAP